MIRADEAEIVHQRNYRHRFSHLAPASVTASLEEEDELLSETLLAEGLPPPPPDDLDPEDPQLLSEIMDLEGKVVDLPCDDDGQVFLAPLRRLEAKEDDAAHDLMESDILAAPASSLEAAPPLSEEDVLDDADDAQRTFGFSRLGGEEEPVETAEPVLRSVIDAPVRRNAITDAFISLKVLPGPEPQRETHPEPYDVKLSLEDEVKSADDKADSDEEDWIGSQLTLPLIDDEIEPGATANKERRANRFLNVAKTTAFGAVQAAAGIVRAAGRNAGGLLLACGGGLRAALAKAIQYLKTLLQVAMAFAVLCARGSYKVAKIAFGLGSRVGLHSVQRLRAASTSLWGLSNRLARRLGPASTGMMSVGKAKSKELLRRSIVWLSALRQSYANDIATFTSFSRVVFARLKTTIIRSSNFLKRSLGSGLFIGAKTARHVASATSAKSRAASGHSLLAIKKTYQFVGNAGDRVCVLMKQNLEHGTLIVAKSVPFVLGAAQKNVMAGGSYLRKLPFAPLGGLTAATAASVLLLTAWSDGETPTFDRSSVVLTVPPKPSVIQKELTQDPIIFDWPTIEAPSNKSADAERVGTLRDEPSAAAEKPSLSPETALAGLVGDAGLTGDGAISVSLTKEQPTISGPGPSPARAGEDRTATLAALTLLADIETIANVGEFTKALRAIGLETLIQPGERYTILAPSDAAFAKLGQDEFDKLLHPSGHGRLRALLSNHVLTKRLEFNDFAGQIKSYRSLANQSITISATDVIKVEKASMIQSDIRAANTVIHVIDDVLLPEDSPSREVPPYVTLFEISSDT